MNPTHHPLYSKTAQRWPWWRRFKVKVVRCVGGNTEPSWNIWVYYANLAAHCHGWYVRDKYKLPSFYSIRKEVDRILDDHRGGAGDPAVEVARYVVELLQERIR
jgi:hypothetical protein